MARPDANKAASTLKEALGGPGVEWATLCCVMRLLKLVIKAQAAAAAASSASGEGSDGGRGGSNVGDSPARAASSGGGTPRSTAPVAAVPAPAHKVRRAGAGDDSWTPWTLSQVVFRSRLRLVVTVTVLLGQQVGSPGSGATSRSRPSVPDCVTRG